MIPFEIASVFEGFGQPIVLLHAFPLSHKLWEKVKVKDYYLTIKPDFPGFGLSPLTGPEFTLSDFVKGLEAHLTDQNIEKPFVLAGISMGGYSAFEYVRQFPEQVQKLILISTRAGVDKPEGRENRLKMAEKIEKDGISGLADTMIPGLLGKTTLSQKPQVVERVRGWINQTSPAAVALAQRAMAARRDQNDLLPALKAKVAVFAGREDTLIPCSEAEAMAKVIPGCQLKIFDQAGHLIPIEAPKEFQKSLEEFLEY